MSPSSAASSAGTWRTLVPVFAACAAIGLQAGVAMPLVPLALEREGADKFTIGVVSAAWAVGMLAFGTRIPALAARLGAARAIVLAVVIGSAITLAYTVTSGPLAWGILSFLHGVVGVGEETGDPITLKRLDARPIATLSIEAQERHERREKVYRDD